MADIAHTVPAIVTANDGSTFGFERPGLQITQFDAGPTRSRDWLGYNLRAYDLDPSLWQSSTTALQEWSAFWHHIGGGSECGYIVEPVSETHRDLVCGGLGDAAQTTFPIPVVAPTSVTVFVDGVPQEAAAYTVHSVANILSDAEATCSDADAVVADSGSDVVVTGVSADGLSCIKVTPSDANPVLRQSVYIAVTTGEVYTAVAAILNTDTADETFDIRIAWSTSDNSYISTDDSSDYTIEAGTWTAKSVTATAPALAAKAFVYPRFLAGATPEPFYVDCMAMNRGDYTRWHLPSQSPGLIEFATAPAAGARITATATGKRVSRCRFEPGSTWRVTGAGHAASRSIRAVEVIEI